MKIKKRPSMQTMILNYVLSIIPLVLYGIYKNGIILFQKGYVSISYIFILLFIPIFAFSMGILIDYLFSKRVDIFNSFLPLYGLIISCLISPGINLLMSFIIILLSLLLIKFMSFQKRITLNWLALSLVIAFIFFIFLGFDYLNLYEKNAKIALGLTDVIFGRGVGGLFSTNIFLMIVALLFLSITKLYKKEIPVYMLGSYVILTMVITLIRNDNINMFFNIANSMVFFSAVFIAPDLLTSPYTRKGKIVYGILLGLLSALCILFINNTGGIFIAILIGSVFVKFIDKIFALK